MVGAGEGIGLGLEFPKPIENVPVIPGLPRFEVTRGVVVFELGVARVLKDLRSNGSTLTSAVFGWGRAGIGVMVLWGEGRKEENKKGRREGRKRRERKKGR